MTPDPADLSNLHDLALPDAVPWWPPAPGWWVVLVLLAAGAVAFVFRWTRAWWADAYRRAALRELETARGGGEVLVVLRRAALAICPRETVASLQGDAWVAWLEERTAEPVPESLRPLIAGGLYDPERAAAADPELVGFARRWLRCHTRPC